MILLLSISIDKMMCVPTVEGGLLHHLYNNVQAEGLLRTHRPMSPEAEYLNDMCEGTSVNVDLARFNDSQETLLDVVDILLFQLALRIRIR